MGVCLLFLSVNLIQSEYTGLEFESIVSAYPSLIIISFHSSRLITVIKKYIPTNSALTNDSHHHTRHTVPTMQPMASRAPVENKSETDVIYVRKSNAKKAKIELESLGYLDKRYKMIPVANDANLIAIPIMGVCLSYLNERNDSNMDKSSFESFIVQVGRESVPFSSSLTGKLKQKR